MYDYYFLLFYICCGESLAQNTVDLLSLQNTEASQVSVAAVYSVEEIDNNG